MLATVVMTWEWQELPIDLWIEKEKLADRITEKTGVVDWYWALYDSICITASEDNVEAVIVSDYTEENQTNDWTIADFIELRPKARLEIPWSKSVQALNRPMVLGAEWDVLRIVAR